MLGFFVVVFFKLSLRSLRSLKLTIALVRGDFM